MERILIRVLLTLLSLGLLAGCGNADDSAWVDYHQELEDALNAPPIERRAPDNIGAFVPRRERLIDIPEVRESMLNIYALRVCDITSLVAARNNQLGRVAPPSQHWLYERELWQRLSLCVNGDTSKSLSENDRARLETLTELKTAQLPAVGWNALFDSDEWEKSFSRASDPWSARSLPDIQKDLGALDYLQQMVEQTYSLEWRASSSQLENHLKTLQARPTTAEAMRTLLLAARRLGEANGLLAENLESGRCLPHWEHGWLDELERNAYRWLVAINALIEAHQVDPPPAVTDYQRQWLSLESAEAPWQRFKTAQLEHLALRTLYSPCAFAPGDD
ncbi:DUF3080 family protein [Vreelandella sp. EE22]